MDDPQIKRLEQELDYAINQARLLRAQLQASPRETVPGDQERARRKHRLHVWLDRIQRLTPEFLRALVRRYYLRHFYYRVYPEYSPRAILSPREPSPNPLAAHSGYPPFLEFKHRLCRELSLDMGVSVDCVPDLVSAVLPVHNGARFVAEAVESVLQQSYANFELIVVDDGSTDETPAILDRYTGNSKVRVTRQTNRRLPAALNAGFAQARGEFFTWISADNRMHPRMLDELAGFLCSQRDVEMVYADEELIDERGAAAMGSDFCREYQSPPGSNILRRPRDPGELNFIQNNFIGGCFLYRAWAARVLGEYSESCFGFEDYDYWMRMNALFRIAHLAKSSVLYSYRLHPGSLTARDKELRIADRARYFTSVEAERRRFFAEGFDVTLAGEHPWFASLARAYRRSGHNVVEMQADSPVERYRADATRAFSKSIVIGDGRSERESFAVLRGDRLTAGGIELAASSAAGIEYPVLALANSVLWAARTRD